MCDEESKLTKFLKECRRNGLHTIKIEEVMNFRTRRDTLEDTLFTETMRRSLKFWEFSMHIWPSVRTYEILLLPPRASVKFSSESGERIRRYEFSEAQNPTFST